MAMTVAELISKENIRRIIAEAQLDFGLAATEEEYIELAYRHLGPESELAELRRALGVLIDTKGLCMKGVDYSFSRPDPQKLYDAGYRFVVRYLAWASSGRGKSVLDGYNNGKVLTRSEAKKLDAAGLDIVSNWEWDPRDGLRGYSGGVYDAKEAKRLHDAAGGPAGAVIYFSVDFDASTSQLATCYEYLKGAASVLGWDRVGVYGSYKTVEYMHARGVKWLWQTYAWSYGSVSSHINLYQYKNGVTLAGGSVDLDSAKTIRFGQWKASAHAQRKGLSAMLGLQMGDSGPEVKLLQTMLKGAGFDPGTIDGNYGKMTRNALYELRQSRDSSASRSNCEKVTAWAVEQIIEAVAIKAVKESGFKGEKGDPGKDGKDGKDGVLTGQLKLDGIVNAEGV